MPVKSPAATPTTPRKRRTRKTNTRTAKAVAKTDKVIKEIQAVLDAPKVKVTKVKAIKQDAKIRTLKSVKRPSTARLISASRYWSDIKTRWGIHNYEITMLISDLTKGLRYVRQFTK